MIEVWDWQGNRWGSSDATYDEQGNLIRIWTPENADTDMANLYGDELERFCGPLFDSPEEWTAAVHEAKPWLKRWLVEDRRHNPELMWTW